MAEYWTLESGIEKIMESRKWGDIWDTESGFCKMWICCGELRSIQVNEDNTEKLNQTLRKQLRGFGKNKDRFERARVDSEKDF